MTNLLKYLPYLVIVVLGIALFTSVRSCQNQKELVQLEKDSHDSTFHEALAVKLKNGQQAFRIKTLEATVSQLKSDGLLTAYEKKQLSDQVGNLNNLVAYWRGSARAMDTIKTTLHDSIYIERSGTKVLSKAFKWDSKYLSLNGLIAPDTVHIAYRYDMDFSLTAYRKGKTWFKPGELVADVTFSDPHVNVSSFQGVVVKEESKKWYQTTAFKIGVGFVGGLFLLK